MAIVTLKRQRSNYDPKKNKFKENVKDFMYALDSAATKAVNSTGSLTNMAVTGQKSGLKSLQQFVENPVGKLKDDWSTISRGTFSNQKMYDDRKSQFEAGKITEEEFKRTEELYDIYSEYKAKDSMYKAKLLQSDKEYQQFVNSRNISLLSPKRAALALTREAAADIMNPYQLAVDLLGGKIGSFAATKLSRYGKWVGIGAELSVSAGTAGTANVVESYSYGRRAPKELVTDFALGATFGFVLSGGSRGIKALRTKALSKASNAVDNAVDSKLAGRFENWDISADDAADLVARQADDAARFINDTPAGREFNRPNVERFTDLQRQNELANAVQYGTVTDNLLDGRFPADDELSKVMGYTYKPHDSYDAARGIVNQNPDAINRLNQWVNDTPDNLKRLTELPDAEIKKIAPNIDGATIREVQNLRSQVIADFGNIDSQFQAAGIDNYDFSRFLDDEYNFINSDRVINIEQLGNLKTMKEPKQVQDIFNSNAYNQDSLFPDVDGYEFNTLQPDMPDDVIAKRMSERINAQNENIAVQERAFKLDNPDKLTSQEMLEWGQRINNLNPEDKSLFKKFIDNNCLIGG